MTACLQIVLVVVAVSVWRNEFRPRRGRNVDAQSLISEWRRKNGA